MLFDMLMQLKCGILPSVLSAQILAHLHFTQRTTPIDIGHLKDPG